MTNNMLLHSLMSSKVVKFFVCSGGGLTLDLSIFLMLTTISNLVFTANILSSFTAICFVFISSNIFVYKTKNYRFGAFLVFVCYHFLAILAFSFLIVLIIDNLGAPEIFAKLVTIPISFFCNYFFTGLIIEKFNER